MMYYLYTEDRGVGLVVGGVVGCGGGGGWGGG